MVEDLHPRGTTRDATGSPLLTVQRDRNLPLRNYSGFPRFQPGHQIYARLSLDHFHPEAYPGPIGKAVEADVDRETAAVPPRSEPAQRAHLVTLKTSLNRLLRKAS